MESSFSLKTLSGVPQRQCLYMYTCYMFFEAPSNFIGYLDEQRVPGYSSKIYGGDSL